MNPDIYRLNSVIVPSPVKKIKEVRSQALNDVDQMILLDPVLSRSDFVACVAVCELWNKIINEKIEELFHKGKIGLYDVPKINSFAKIKDFINNNKGLISLNFTRQNAQYCDESFAFRQRVSTGIAEGIEHLTDLTNLDLHGCKGISSQNISYWLPKLEKLTSLNLGRTDYHADNFKEFSRLTNLTQLDVSDFDSLAVLGQCVRIDDLEGISKMKKLSELNASYLPISFGRVDELTSLPLTSLNLSHCRLNKGILSQIHKISTLTQLNLSHSINKLQDLSRLKHLMNLTSLDVANCESWVLGEIKNLTNLSTLNISSCPKVTDFELVEFKDLHNKNSNDRFEIIPAFKNLVTLDLSYCANVTDVGFSALSSLLKLRYLNLSGCNITGEGLKALNLIKNLNTLNLSYCSKILDRDLNVLPLRKLSLLDLSGCSITGTGLNALRKLQYPFTLNLSHCEKLTDKGLSVLNSVNYLCNLIISNCQNISDRGISHISRHKRLAILDLSGSKITYKGLSKLSLLTSLVSLNLTNCRPEGSAEMGDEEFSVLYDLSQLGKLELGSHYSYRNYAHERSKLL